jgi:two-component system cell cycle response regulator DivK
MNGPCVLVVEDEPLNATLITAMLTIAGVGGARVINSGAELARVLDDMSQIDLVLLDLQLPGEDGYALLPRLRAHAKTAKTPVLAVTAQVMPDAVDKAESAGFDGFIGKPLNFDRFPDQIRRALAGQRVWDPR